MNHDGFQMLLVLVFVTASICCAELAIQRREKRIQREKDAAERNKMAARMFRFRERAGQ